MTDNSDQLVRRAALSRHLNIAQPALDSTRSGWAIFKAVGFLSARNGRPIIGRPRGATRSKDPDEDEEEDASDRSGVVRNQFDVN